MSLSMSFNSTLHQWCNDIGLYCAVPCYAVMLSCVAVHYVVNRLVAFYPLAPGCMSMMGLVSVIMPFTTKSFSTLRNRETKRVASSRTDSTSDDNKQQVSGFTIEIV